jgi:dTDP-4-amino-4,6-dideoxygalactose transaminase
VASGRHGIAGCFSMQTYKHINSGEGGFLISDDAGLMARAILLSGSYMLYARHRAAPPPELFETIRLDVPNISSRMDNLRAAILRPQLPLIEERRLRWAERYRRLEDGLAGTPGIALIARPAEESFVGSSFQFRLPDWDAARIRAFVAACGARGVELKWFGAPEPVAFTSRYDHWRYAAAAPLPRTDRLLAGLIDMRLPLTFSLEDVALIARILRDEALRLGQGGPTGAELVADDVPLAD